MAAMPDSGSWWNWLTTPSTTDATSAPGSATTDVTPPAQNPLQKASKMLGPVGDILGGVGDIMGGIQQQQQDSAQATRFRQESWIALGNAGKEVQAEGQKGIAAISQASAAAGAGGVTSGGSVANAQRQTVDRVTEAEVASRYSGEITHIEDQYEANQMVWAGKQAFWGGIMGGVQGFIKAGESVATGGMSDMVPQS